MLRSLTGAAALASLAVAAPAVAQSTNAIVTPPPPLVVTVAPPVAVDGAELAEAQAIVATMFPEGQESQMVAQLIEALSAQFRAALPADAIADPGLRAILNTYLDALPARLMPTVDAHLPRMLEATAVAYSNAFTLAELREIHAFAKTATGRRYFASSAALVADPAVAAANTAYFVDLQQLSADAQDELKTKIRGYLEDHPDLAAKVPQQAS